jgi:hypothetical protein
MLSCQAVHVIQAAATVAGCFNVYNSKALAAALVDQTAKFGELPTVHYGTTTARGSSASALHARTLPRA